MLSKVQHSNIFNFCLIAHENDWGHCQETVPDNLTDIQYAVSSNLRGLTAHALKESFSTPKSSGSFFVHKIHTTALQQFQTTDVNGKV